MHSADRSVDPRMSEIPAFRLEFLFSVRMIIPMIIPISSLLGHKAGRGWPVFDPWLLL